MIFEITKSCSKKYANGINVLPMMLLGQSSNIHLFRQDLV